MTVWFRKSNKNSSEYQSRTYWSNRKENILYISNVRFLVGKPEGKRLLGRPRRRWVDNIRTDLQEVGCGYMDWIWLAQDRDRCRTLVSAVLNLRVPWNAGNFLSSCKPVSFSRTLHRGVSKWVGRTGEVSFSETAAQRSRCHLIGVAVFQDHVAS